MNFFRDSDVKGLLALEGVLTFLAFLLSAIICGMTSSIIILSLSFILIFIHLFYIYKKNKKIALLSNEIDKVLHGDYSLSFDGLSEGALGVLQSEIYKMTITLREKQSKLTKDKEFLATSLSDISHQIKTPLTSMNLMLSMIFDPQTSKERRERLKGELFVLMGKTENLVSTLLKISKLDAGTVAFKKEKISLRELADKACFSMLVPFELKEVALQINASGNFEGDVTWSAEALTNIIKNCLEHTQRGGRVSFDALENPLYTEITISDNGSGIEKEDLPHIFERFYKGKNQTGGFGIGLFLSRMIIISQNGTIKAENRADGAGAVFTVRFYKNVV